MFTSLRLVVLGCLVGFTITFAALAAEFGANKFDLVLQYTNPTIPGGSDPVGYRRVRRAMATKSIADARDAGLTFLRVGVAGYSPADFVDRQNDLALWQADPAAYWAEVDQMFDDLDREHLQIVPSFLWNIAQFPSLARESVATFVRNPNSASHQLFDRYIREFIARYKSRRTILFYELTNEMNNFADIDERSRCKQGANIPCVWDNFTTADMIVFSRESVALVKSLDPSRQVTSGYAAPRPAATHLMARPAFGPGGPDWTLDSAEQFKRYLVLIHQPFDIVSVHIYPTADNDRFGRATGQEAKLVSDAAAAAKSVGKPLFISEWGAKGPTPFMKEMLDEIVRDRVAYSAIWVWEFYQMSTYRTYDTDPDKFNVEPGYSDSLIGMIEDAERKTGGHPPARATDAPPRVVLTWPLPCAAITQPIDLFAVASDGARAVKSVEFQVNGKSIGASVEPPYSARLDPSGLGAKVVAVEARATSASGATAGFTSEILLNGAKGACDAEH